MSGVYIKDLEMPKTCGECLLYHLRPSGESYCAYNLFTVAEHERPADCPLVEVPDHGPLIDITTKTEVQIIDEAYSEWTMKTATVEDILNDLCDDMPPIIIPADKED